LADCALKVFDPSTVCSARRYGRRKLEKKEPDAKYGRLWSAILGYDRFTF
jgi:hypothetical protein